MSRSAIALRGIVGLLVLRAAPLFAQAKTVTFLPGLNEGPSVWSAATTNLSASFNIGPLTPFLSTTDPVQSQSASLGTLDPTSYVVGHSLGGVVARVKAQSQTLAGVITLGTPNQGAPIVENIPDFCQFISGTVFDGVWLVETLWPGDQWIYDGMALTYPWAVDELTNLCTNIVNSSGIAGSLANRTQLAPHGRFMPDTLNSFAAIAAEQAHVGTEVSVIVTTDNYFDAGPYKAASPDGAGESAGHALDGFAAYLAGTAAYIELNDDMQDQHNVDLVTRLDALANDLLFADQAWCDAVEATVFYCAGSDEIVPLWSQNLGRGIPIQIPSGPVHQREAQNGGVLLPGAFVAAGIPAR